MSRSKFSENPYWRTEYAPPISELLNEIQTKFQYVKGFAENSSNDYFLRGYFNYFIGVYITECNIGENTGTQECK